MGERIWKWVQSLAKTKDQVKPEVQRQSKPEVKLQVTPQVKTQIKPVEHDKSKRPAVPDVYQYWPLIEPKLDFTKSSLYATPRGEPTDGIANIDRFTEKGCAWWFESQLPNPYLCYKHWATPDPCPLQGQCRWRHRITDGEIKLLWWVNPRQAALWKNWHHTGKKDMSNLRTKFDDLLDQALLPEELKVNF